MNLTPNEIDLLQKLLIFQFIGEPSVEWELLFSLFKKERFEKGHQLLQQGGFNNKIYVLINGEIRINSYGWTIDLLQKRPGFTVGEVTFVRNYPVPWVTVTAETEIEALVVEHEVLWKFIVENPEIGIRMLRGIAVEATEKLGVTSSRLIEVISESRVTSLVHDIRSPLATLKVLVDQLQFSSEEQRIGMESAVSRLEVLSSNLLKPTSSKPLQEAESACISDCSLPANSRSSLDELLVKINNLVHEKKVQFKSQSDICFYFTSGLFSNHVSIEYDFIEITRILSNLIDNAIKSKSKPMTVIMIHIKVEIPNLVLSVSDNGSGVSKELVGILGERPIDGSHSEGNGIAVYHAQQALLRLGGRLMIESTAEVGSKFSIVLPLEGIDSRQERIL